MKSSEYAMHNDRIDSNDDVSPRMDQPTSQVKQRNRYDYFSSNAQGAQGSQMRIESNVKGAGNKASNSNRKKGSGGTTLNEMGLP